MYIFLENNKYYFFTRFVFFFLMTGIFCKDNKSKICDNVKYSGRSYMIGDGKEGANVERGVSKTMEHAIAMLFLFVALIVVIIWHWWCTNPNCEDGECCQECDEEY